MGFKLLLYPLMPESAGAHVQQQAIHDWHTTGKTPQEIADEYDVTQSPVSQWVNSEPADEVKE